MEANLKNPSKHFGEAKEVDSANLKLMMANL